MQSPRQPTIAPQEKAWPLRIGLSDHGGRENSTQNIHAIFIDMHA